MATGLNGEGCWSNSDMTNNKKVQCCALCKNHKEVSPKKGHQCPFRGCPCLLCELTRKAQKFMRHQQRFWRHQKSKLKNYQKYPELKVDEDLVDDNGQLKGQVCDKCRNHNHLTRKKNHNCPFIVCECEFCSLTFKRRKVMKHQQRVRRSNITTKVALDPSAEADSKDYHSDTEVLDYKKLSILISMNSTDDAHSEYEDALSGCSSSYSEVQMNNYEELPSPSDSRNRSSPPPLIPIDVTNAHDSTNEHISNHNPEQHFAFRKGYNLPAQCPKSYSPYSRLETSMTSLAGLGISSSPVPKYESTFVKNSDLLNSPHIMRENSYSPLSTSENSMSPQLENDRLVPPNSKMDERIPSIADEYYNLRQKALLKSDWNSYVQPPSVFQTVARGINYPS